MLPLRTCSIAAFQVPAGFSPYNNNLDHYNSLYWDKRAMALYPGDVSKATITHWLLYLNQSYTPVLFAHAWSTSVPHSIKRPLENRIWYAYADQNTIGSYVGSWTHPTQVARVLDDGTSQIAQATYNAQGQATSRTDPLGRRQALSYAANGIDLLEVRQTTSGLNDLLAGFGSYTPQHRPQTMIDAAGQTTTATYNPAGQVLTVTNAKRETTTSAYDANGYLRSVTGPVAGATTTFTDVHLRRVWPPPDDDRRRWVRPDARLRRARSADARDVSGRDVRQRGLQPARCRATPGSARARDTPVLRSGAPPCCDPRSPGSDRDPAVVPVRHPGRAHRCERPVDDVGAGRREPRHAGSAGGWHDGDRFHVREHDEAVPGR